MQMVIGCGRGTAGMAKNHIKTNIIGSQCVVECVNPILHVGPQKHWSRKFKKKQRFNAHPVLRQGGACARGRGGTSMGPEKKHIAGDNVSGMT